MGAFFWVRSVTLVEDINISEADFISKPEMAEDAYRAQAKNCWIVAGIYAVVLGISGQQMWANIRPKPFMGL